MSKKAEKRLLKAYTKYRTAKNGRNVLEILRANMAEIIFHTTKLEGEPVTRKMISSLFK